MAVLGGVLFLMSEVPLYLQRRLRSRLSWVKSACQVPGGLVFKAHRWVYHSTLGLRVIQKKKIEKPSGVGEIRVPVTFLLFLLYSCYRS